MLPAVNVTIDATRFNQRLSPERVKKALRAGTRAAQFEYLSRVRQGFEVGGWNPETGEGGFWKPRRVPTDKEGNPIKGRAKLRNGTVVRIRIGGRTLVNTGSYVRSINASPLQETASGVSGFVGVGSEVPYAKFHEQVGNPRDSIQYRPKPGQIGVMRKLGFTVGKNTIVTLPKRRVFVSPASWRKDMSRIIAEEATEALNG